MIKNGIFKTAMVLFLGVLASGCHKVSIQPKLLDNENVSVYGLASCEYKADQGNAALSELPKPELVTTYFGKRFDQSLLSAVLTVSASETVRFAELAKVKFYSVAPYKKESCMLASFLPEASGVYQSKFNSVGDSAVGLYLPSLDGTNDVATILVRRDSNRWVLVHEFMHHLFSKEVQRGEKSDDQVKADLNNALEGIDAAERNYKESRSAEDGKSYLNLIMKMSLSMSEILRRFSLEEMTIETLLSDKLKSGQLLNVPKNQAINGAAYIYQNAKKAETNLVALREFENEAKLIIQELDGKISANEISFFKKYFEVAEITNAEFKLSINELKFKAEKTIRDSKVDLDRFESGNKASKLAGFNPTASVDEMSGVDGCAHSHEVEKLTFMARKYLSSRPKK
jgi:hypothetical protein